jgi:hypothetical protein
LILTIAGFAGIAAADRPAAPELAVSLAGSALRLELRTAAPDPPRLARTVDRLRDGAALFALSPGAGCQPQASAVTPPAADRRTLVAWWAFRCTDPAALRWLEARLFGLLPGMDRVAVRVTAPRGTKSVVLTPGVPRLLMP